MNDEHHSEAARRRVAQHEALLAWVLRVLY